MKYFTILYFSSFLFFSTANSQTTIFLPRSDWKYLDTVQARNNLGAVSTSVPAYLSALPTPPENTAPTVSLTSPAIHSSYVTPASIFFNASAADSDGTISSVAFYNGGTLLGRDKSNPYSYAWTNVAAGDYSLTARATDNTGAVTTSTTVSIAVNGTAPPPPTNAALTRGPSMNSAGLWEKNFYSRKSYGIPGLR